ncbi:MAG: hypothetical protein HC889_00565 [Synechococcaceae cyanobacterium SM1_2_3]|nr:hypothetical protein [Synechococcaceae cyanobacterium SM1_2_3]
MGAAENRGRGVMRETIKLEVGFFWRRTVREMLNSAKLYGDATFTEEWRLAGSTFTVDARDSFRFRRAIADAERVSGQDWLREAPKGFL